LDDEGACASQRNLHASVGSGSFPGITAAQHGRPLYPEELRLLTKLLSVGHEKNFSNFADMRVCLPQQARAVHQVLARAFAHPPAMNQA
jgi:hypothetical protein